ncbi:hypothetical protein Drorol1_Dr00008866 [Drosera rotundifolia]
MLVSACSSHLGISQLVFAIFLFDDCRGDARTYDSETYPPDESVCVCMVAVWYVTLYAIAWCYGIDDVGVMGSPMVSILEEVIEFMITKLKYHNSEEDKDEDASKSRS